MKHKVETPASILSELEAALSRSLGHSLARDYSSLAVNASLRQRVAPRQGMRCTKGRSCLLGDLLSWQITHAAK